MTKTIARAYAGENISPSPSARASPAPTWSTTISQPRGQKILADIPLGRIATPAEIAETARWLALDAPPSATGAVIDVNGASFVR